MAQINPTRMELSLQKKRLLTARRGHKLLKDKRDELMKRFLDMIKDNMALRLKVEEKIKKLNASFAIAAAYTSDKIIEESLSCPKVSANITVDTQNIMSVNVPIFNMENGVSGDIYSYGFAFTSGSLDSALAYLNEILPDLIKLAESEKSCELLSREIERTRRRVNALEYIMIPEYMENIRSISSKLEENERGNTTRLMKVKDMMLNEARKG